MSQTTPVERTQEYFLKEYGVELTEEQTRTAMRRLVRHFQWLTKWHSDKGPATSSILPLPEGRMKNAC